MPVKEYAPPLPPDLSAFDAPPVHIGDAVEAATSPEWRDARPGRVASIANDGKDLTISVLLPNGDTRILYDCIHRSDPRCTQQRDRFLDNQSGVWDVANSTRRIINLERRITALESGAMNPRPTVPAPSPQIEVPRSAAVPPGSVPGPVSI